jgi:lipoyl(octanoyl) transferase
VHDVRLIIDPAAPGAWNMAVDEALLHDAAESGLGTLRFYAWSEPTLSLGYFQRVLDRDQHAASRQCALVRRQTGGGAILHDREITYSLVLPASHPLARSAPELYAAAHDAVIAVLSPLALRGSGYKLLRLDGSTQNAERGGPFLCFQRRAAGDVLLIGQPDQARSATQSPQEERSALGTKVLGSAQRRLGGALLQHGSLLLERSSSAPELAGWRDLTGAMVGTSELVAALADRLASVLTARLIRHSISKNLQSKAGEFANSKYGTAAWTNRR